MPHVSPDDIDADTDANVAFEPDRGFDWGSEQDSGAMPKRRRFGRRAATVEADPSAGPEVVYEPAPDADITPARPRMMVGRGSLIAILVLAAVCGMAAVKVFTTDTAALDTSSSTTVEAPLAVPPSDGVTPPADPVDATTAPATPKKQGAPKQGVKPAGTPPATAPGNAVADDGGLDTLADAVAEAGTAPAVAASDPAPAQVPASDADTPVATASAAKPSTNPFARPE
jgi:hypothetical protein